MNSNQNGQIEETPGEDSVSPRISGCHVRVLDIARYHDRWKLTPEQIVEELRVLSLADVYAALAYYHSNKDDMDAQIEDEAKIATEIGDEVSRPLKERLAELDARMIRYHLDRSCPYSLGEVLRQRGIDVTTTPEVWLTKASDREQLSYAASCRRIILTRDLDFLGLKSECDREHCGIFYIHPDRTHHETVKILCQIHEHLDANQFINRVEFI